MGWDKPILTDSGGFQVFSRSDAQDHGRGREIFFPDQWRALIPVAGNFHADSAFTEFRYRDAVRRMHTLRN
jgi:queuine/archaeosine tRNA-ribosyltransferase